MNVRERNGKWQARVTAAGQTVSRTFSTRSDATKWARHQQVLMERGEYEAPREAITLAKVIERYERDVLPSKRGAAQERYVLAAWKNSPLGKRTLNTIKPTDIAQARDKRLKEVSSGSVRRYLDTLSAVFEVAIRDWELSTTNPVRAIRKPENGRARERRLMPGELERITAASGAPDFGAIVTLAAETAMRRSEILGLQWKHIDLHKRVALLPLTKNGDSRTVPLTLNAVAVLRTLPRRIDGKVFNKNGTSLSCAFQRAVQRARKAYERERAAEGANPDDIEHDEYLQGLRLHDLRHERITALVEGGMNLIEVAAISGHKSMQCLKRYSHVSPSHLIEKLDAMC